MTHTIKSAEDIEKMRIAGKMAADCLTMIGEHVKPGVTTGELDKLCHDFIVNDCKAIPACLGYRGFPKSVCTSIDHVVCHGIPHENQVLKEGQILNIDVTVIFEGWHGDTSKMYIVGQKVKPPAERLVQKAQEALYLGIDMVKPGLKLGDLGFAIEQFAKQNHYSSVRDYCGHGIGQKFHEDPMVNHFGTPGTGMELVPGMTFTIEPMLNQGTHICRVLADDWTVITKDRKLSAQWEHTILVTPTGREVLTYREGEEVNLVRATQNSKY